MSERAAALFNKLGYYRDPQKDWGDGLEAWTPKDTGNTLQIEPEELTHAIYEKAAEQIEDFLATNDPAYGYTQSLQGWENPTAAQQTIESMLRDNHSWFEQAFSGLVDERPELKEQTDFWASVVHDFGDLETPVIVGEITYWDSNETLTFSDSDAYLAELRKAFDVRGINGWSHKTHTTDVDTRYQVASLTHGEFGEEVDKEAFYRLYEQHGADMGTWGDSSQWIVSEDMGYYTPEASTIPPPSIELIKEAHRQIDRLVALTSPKEVLDNVLSLENYTTIDSPSVLLFNAAEELTNKSLTDLFPKKVKQGFFDRMSIDEMREWLEFGAFKGGQLFARKPSDLKRSRPFMVAYQAELYWQAITELHKNIETASQNDLVVLEMHVHNYVLNLPKDPLQAVTENGENLKDIAAQTPEICLAAVQNRGWALEYVKQQTPEICLAAVKQSGFALEYVHEQTPEICLAAVKQSGFALKYVKQQTPEICLAAVKQSRFALRYVKEQTPEICFAAGQQPPTQEQNYDVQIPVTDKLTARVSIKVRLEEATQKSNAGRSSSPELTPTKDTTEAR